MQREITSFIPNSLVGGVTEETPIAEIIDQSLSKIDNQNTKNSYRSTLFKYFDFVGIQCFGDFVDLPFSLLNLMSTAFIDSFSKYLEDHNTDKTGFMDVINSDTELKKAFKASKKSYAGYKRFEQKLTTSQLVRDTTTPKASRTQNTKAYTITKFYKYFMFAHSYPKNPLGDFKAKKVSRKSKTASLSPKELTKLLFKLKLERHESLINHRDYVIVCLMALMSYRRSEVVSIRYEKINFDDGIIEVKRKAGLEVENSGSPALFKILKEYCLAAGITEGYVFKSNRGTSKNPHLTAQAVYYMIKKKCADVAPKKNITPHSMRSTFVRAALDIKESLERIANSTDHATIEMIKYYDTRSTTEESAALSMDRFL